MKIQDIYLPVDEDRMYLGKYFSHSEIKLDGIQDILTFFKLNSLPTTNGNIERLKNMSCPPQEDYVRFELFRVRKMLEEYTTHFDKTLKEGIILNIQNKQHIVCYTMISIERKYNVCITLNINIITNLR
jgi:hypothetical protein